MAGKSWQPSHELPGIHHTLTKEWKEKGGTGKGKQPLSRFLTLETQTLKENADQVKLLECLEVQEHVESCCMHRSKCH